MRRVAISLCLIGVLGAGASACGSDHDAMTTGPASSVAAGTPTTTAQVTGGAVVHNDVDVMFVQGMIPHHEQALTMATMALDAKVGASAEVTALATKISAAQTPEIDLMQGWLDDWIVPMSVSTDMHNMGGSTPAGAMGGSDGMMSDADMQALASARGPAFDKLWLTAMVAHHEGAIAMAISEQQNGTNPDALELAVSIADGQATEVAEMQQLLGAIG